MDIKSRDTSEGSFELGVDLSNHERSQTIFKFDRLPAEESGRYHIAVELKVEEQDWQDVASIPLRITFEISDDKGSEPEQS